MKLLLMIALLTGFVVPTFAEVPKLMSYSGKLVTKGGKIITDGNYDMRFSLYTVPAGGSPVWSEFHEGTTYAVPVTAGAFQTVLGSVQPTSNPLPAFNANYYLEVRAFIKGAWEIFGRQPMLSVPYAMQANGIDDNAVSTSKITSRAVTYDKIATGADLPIGTILAWHANLAGMPPLPAQYVRCDGGTVPMNIGSPIAGQPIPNLNGEGRFLRGAATSGMPQADMIRSHEHPNSSEQGGIGFAQPGSGTDFTFWVHNQTRRGFYGEAETRPINMSVVWIMKVK